MGFEPPTFSKIVGDPGDSSSQPPTFGNVGDPRRYSPQHTAAHGLQLPKGADADSNSAQSISLNSDNIPMQMYSERQRIIAMEDEDAILCGSNRSNAKKSVRRFLFSKNSSIDANIISKETSRLSSNQRRLIHDSFLRMNCNSGHNGLRIFARYLSEHPEYKPLWPNFRSIPDSAIISSDALQRHACVYMGGLRRFVESMENDEELAKEAYVIAKSHVTWHVHKIHITNMLPGVIAVLRECLNGRDPITEEAWTMMFDVIANLIDMFHAHHAVKPFK